MNDKPLVSLDSLKPELKSGDLVFFQGIAADSVLIRDVTGGTWSHCAMVVRGDDIGCDEHELLLFESSVTAGHDIGFSGGDGSEKAGVMLVDFTQRMNNYAASKEYAVFGIRNLREECVEGVNTEELRKFTLNAHVRGSIYPAEHLVAAGHFIAKELETEQFSSLTVVKIQNELKENAAGKLSADELKLVIAKTIEAAQENLDPAAQDKTRHKHSETSHYFCSELVVDALMHMGILDIGNAAGYSPSDLSDDKDSPLDAFYTALKYIPGDLGSR